MNQCRSHQSDGFHSLGCPRLEVQGHRVSKGREGWSSVCAWAEWSASNPVIEGENKGVWPCHIHPNLSKSPRSTCVHLIKHIYYVYIYIYIQVYMHVYLCTYIRYTSYLREYTPIYIHKIHVYHLIQSIYNYIYIYI